MRLIHRLGLGLLLLGLLAPIRADDSWLPVTPDHLPRWRGFNLLEKFNIQGVKPFNEDEFRMIHEFGFNFVRVPMDYRIWIKDGDWTQIDDRKAFADLDQALIWAAKYHIHVCLNFHRAPGYTVAKPPEARSLWTDPEAQRVCALHWAAFARHFKGIPADRLSFDLFNEPPKIDEAVYAKVVGLMVAAIRQEDPQRLILADGLAWGNQPCPTLAPLHIGQMTRGYEPHLLTHYHASWMAGSDTWPVPTWPLVSAYSFLYGPDKNEFRWPLVITGDFPAGTRLDLVVHLVSVRARLVVRADQDVVLDQRYAVPAGANPPRAELDAPLSIILPRAAKTITLSNEDGDWMSLTSLDLVIGGSTHPLALQNDWGKKQPSGISFVPGRPGAPWDGPDAINRAWLWQHNIVPWRQLQAQGVGVMVGEWGCYDKTPYDVTLHWMEDNLANFQRAGWGWALWNFSGGFGILDSDRPGAVYENYEGHKLDRRMLQLLQKY